MTTYDYWIFYKISDKSIYAYTDQKDLYKKFKSQRNMNKFYYKKLELTKEEVHSLTKELYENILKEKKLNTKNNSNHKDSINFAITNMEDTTILVEGADMIACGLSTKAWTPYFIFKDDIKKALIILNYNRCFDNINDGITMFDAFEIDELGIFLRYYGDTLR